MPLEPMAPDLAGWRVERMPELPETAHFSLAPDWVCEVISKSTENRDRNEKLPIYAEHGVRHVWLVDPIAQTLEVHTLGDDARWREVRCYAGDARVMPVSARHHALRSSSSCQPSGRHQCRGERCGADVLAGRATLTITGSRGSRGSPRGRFHPSPGTPRCNSRRRVGWNHNPCTLGPRRTPRGSQPRSLRWRASAGPRAVPRSTVARRKPQRIRAPPPAGNCTCPTGRPPSRSRCRRR